MDLFYNWLCSAKEAGVIVRPYLVVVTTSESLAKELMDGNCAILFGILFASIFTCFILILF